MKLLNFKLVHVAIIAIVVWLLWGVFGTLFEMFHSGTDITPFGSYWWNSTSNPKIGYPYYNAPMGDDASAGGDMELANMYRKWHNLDDITRHEIFEHAHLSGATPGGDDGTNRQWYIAEALDREQMKVQKQINDHITAKRRPYTDAYADGVPTTAMGGNYFDCAVTGGCQWQNDLNGDILGIPSVPGVLHPYY